jgi:hypothetical protein
MRGMGAQTREPRKSEAWGFALLTDIGVHQRY